MKLSKINSNGYKVYMEEYNSILEFVQTINSRQQNPEITSKMSENGDYSFTGTHNYNEAENLLLHGWTEESEKLNEMLKLKTLKEKSVKNTYDVAGFQCSVPRYLQGIPTNMINQKVVTKKQKVITITKNISYAAHVSKETIEQEVYVKNENGIYKYQEFNMNSEYLLKTINNKRNNHGLNKMGKSVLF